MPSAIVTSMGRVTIPQVIRERLKLKTGDRLDFVIEGDVVTLRSATGDVRSLKGMLHPTRRKPVSVEEMDAAIVGHHRAKAR